MKDKEKHIEYIEKIKNALPPIEVIKAMYSDIDFARYLYDHNCRIVAKDIVILSKEEYDEIKIYQSYIPEMKKAFDKVRNATLEMCKDEIEHWKNHCKEIGDVAVRNILAELKQALIINNEENTEFFDYNYTLETIDDFAKHYEVKNGKQNSK